MSVDPSVAELNDKGKIAKVAVNYIFDLVKTALPAEKKDDLQRAYAEGKTKLGASSLSDAKRQLSLVEGNEANASDPDTQMAWLKTEAALHMFRRMGNDFKIAAADEISKCDTPEKLKEATDKLDAIYTAKKADADKIIQLRKESAELINNPGSDWKTSYATAFSKQDEIRKMLETDPELVRAVAAGELIEKLGLKGATPDLAAITAAAKTEVEDCNKDNEKVRLRIGEPASVGGGDFGVKVDLGDGKTTEIGGGIALRILQLQMVKAGLITITPPKTETPVGGTGAGGGTTPAATKGGVTGITGEVVTLKDGRQAFQVNGIEDSSSAAKAGVKVGDVIIGYGPKKFDESYNFPDAQDAATIGTEQPLQILRPGKVGEEDKPLTLNLATVSAEAKTEEDKGEGDKTKKTGEEKDETTDPGLSDAAYVENRIGIKVEQAHMIWGSTFDALNVPNDIDYSKCKMNLSASDERPGAKWIITSFTIDGKKIKVHDSGGVGQLAQALREAKGKTIELEFKKPGQYVPWGDHNSYNRTVTLH